MGNSHSIIIEQSTNYAFSLQNEKTVSFEAIRKISSLFFRLLPQEIQKKLFDEISHGVCPLDSEPHLNTYMYVYGKMHNAKLRRAYDHLSENFRRENCVDIVDYGCGQGLGCICYADFLREKGIRQQVRRVVLIEPSEMALARAALHVSLLFPDAELKTVKKGFDDLTADDLPSDSEVATLHILSNVLDFGDSAYRLDDFADLVANTLKGRNEFVCVEPLFNGYNKDDKPYYFFERVNIKTYFNVQYRRNEFVPGKPWTCAILLGTVNDGLDIGEGAEKFDDGLENKLLARFTISEYKALRKVEELEIKKNSKTGKLFLAADNKPVGVIQEGLDMKKPLCILRFENLNDEKGYLDILTNRSEEDLCNNNGTKKVTRNMIMSMILSKDWHG